jgi:hypothetical protein
MSHKSIAPIPQDPKTADALETLKTGEAMNLEKVCNLMGTPPGMIKDGLTQQFLSDLDKYLAETFCHILPTPKNPTENPGEPHDHN